MYGDLHAQPRPQTGNAQRPTETATTWERSASIDVTLRQYHPLSEGKQTGQLLNLLELSKRSSERHLYPIPNLTRYSADSSSMNLKIPRRGIGHLLLLVE